MILGVTSLVAILTRRNSGGIVQACSEKTRDFFSRLLMTRHAFTVAVSVMANRCIHSAY
jgi:hypothetical protein